MAQVHLVCGDNWLEVYIDGTRRFMGHEMGNRDLLFRLLEVLGHSVTREWLMCECGHGHEFHSGGGECHSCDCPMFQARLPGVAVWEETHGRG